MYATYTYKQLLLQTKSITNKFTISPILRLKLNKSYAFLVFNFILKNSNYVDFIAIYYEVSFAGIR